MARKKTTQRGGERKAKPSEIPPGFKLRHTLREHGDDIGEIAWSPDGRTLASPSQGHTIRLWDAKSGECLRTLSGHSPTPEDERETASLVLYNF